MRWSCAVHGEITSADAIAEEPIALIAQTGGLPPEEELRELGIAYGSIPA